MEIIGNTLDTALIILAIIVVILSRFEYGTECLTTLVWVAILLAWAGL